MEEALTKPRNVTHTLYKLYNWLQMGIIDLNPEFQRAIKQSHLVDSVLNNFYVPPVIFSCKKLDNKRWIRVCIDGKQRLTAIKKFMEGEIPHVSPSDGNVAKRYYKNVNGKKTLSEPERELFDCSELLCVEYYDLSLQQEQEIFSRVQLGVALTPAEKLQAISSPMADFAHSIFSKYPSISLIMDTKRARPFQLITQSLHMIENEPEKFNATPAVITKFLKEERQVPSNLKIIAERIYQTLEAMIADNSDVFHKDNRLAPVEFVFLTYMIAKYPAIKQSHLVDSVLNNFYVPPVIFSCKKLDNKRWIRVCIDGKQRLTAIKKFMEGEIPHVSPSDGNVAKRYYKNVNGKKTLSEPERELFDCSELLCVEYYDLSLQQEQEIFSRVQLGVALTPAEKLQAISSPMADFAHSIFSKYPSISLIMDTKRARPFQLITQSLHMIENEPEKFNATPAVITKFLKEERQVPSNLKIIAERIYQTLEAMIADNSDVFHKDNRLAPVEFVFLTYMIAKYPGLLISHYQSRLLAMKKHVRQKHDDIRFNNKVYDTLKRFVDGMESEYIVTSSSSTSSKPLASNDVLYKTESTNYGVQQSSSSRPKKRNKFTNN
ncbi:8032_t:CDS:2 [Entrophospora sp. SA101]|nr:8032_t:CDS:2 [Entrophospora sp. SA101]